MEFAYSLYNRTLLYLIATFPIFTIVVAGLTDISLLPYVKNILNGTFSEYGMSNAFNSIGTFLDGVIFIFFSKTNKMKLYILGLIITGLSFVIFRFNANYVVALLIMYALGIAFFFIEICMADYLACGVLLEQPEMLPHYIAIRICIINI